MASKRRLRRKACGGKHRHASQEEAVAHSISLRRKGETGVLNAYHCGYCGGYHVGHAPRQRLRKGT
jgi:hypothetical protein